MADLTNLKITEAETLPQSERRSRVAGPNPFTEPLIASRETGTARKVTVTKAQVKDVTALLRAAAKATGNGVAIRCTIDGVTFAPQSNLDRAPEAFTSAPDSAKVEVTFQGKPKRGQ